MRAGVNERFIARLRTYNYASGFTMRSQHFVSSVLLPDGECMPQFSSATSTVRLANPAFATHKSGELFSRYLRSCSMSQLHLDERRKTDSLRLRIRETEV